MLDETRTVSTPTSAESIRRLSYAELASKANSLRLGLESSAVNCRSDAERRRLRVLASAVYQVYQCLRDARAGVR